MMNLTHKGRNIRIMEVCGTHTSTIVRGGVRSLLPETVQLVSGPGCPVCVTEKGYIDKLCRLAREGNVICTFGDMIKVPGETASLYKVRAEGCDVRMVYSPFDVIKFAEEGKPIVFAAVGFETIAPVYALLISRLAEQKIENVRILTAIKRITPALEWLCTRDVDGFLAPGHVAAVTGSEIFVPLAKKFGRPFCVAGFTPQAVTLAIKDLISQIEDGRCEVHNLYPSVVSSCGNQKALSQINCVFETGNAAWRGLGEIKDSGYYLRPEYARFDAGSREIAYVAEHTACRCGRVICGEITPPECPLFGKVCTPMNAQGPCMVSSEGACGIWYQCGGGL